MVSECNSLQVNKLDGRRVLILVLVEDGLGVKEFKTRMELCGLGLNPCFSGGWSRRAHIVRTMKFVKNSLNPCFSGGWSRSSTSCGASIPCHQS